MASAPERRVALVCSAVAPCSAAKNLCGGFASILPQDYVVIVLPFVLLPVGAGRSIHDRNMTFNSRPQARRTGYLPQIAGLILRVGYKLRVNRGVALRGFRIAAASFSEPS